MIISLYKLLINVSGPFHESDYNGKDNDYVTYCILQIRPEAAYLYDAVNLYARAVLKLLDKGHDPHNGTAIIDAIKGSNYNSAMG